LPFLNSNFLMTLIKTRMIKTPPIQRVTISVGSTENPNAPSAANGSAVKQNNPTDFQSICRNPNPIREILPMICASVSTGTATSAPTQAVTTEAVQRFAERNARLPEKSEYIPANGLPSYALFSRIAESALTDSLSERLSGFINRPTQELSEDTVENGFEARVRELLPKADQEAMRKWLGYAQELEQDGTQPATDFFKEIYVELALVKQHDGSEIARQLFDIGRSFTFNPNEIRGAARLLKQGMAMEAVCQNALNGYCDPTPQESQESRDMLYSLTYPQQKQENKRVEPGESPLDKKLKSFSSDQARLIRDAVEKAVSYALKEAVPNEDELYCEIDHDLVNRYLIPLEDMGTRLSIEKLAEIIDAHPAVDYTDYHNTGIRDDILEKDYAVKPFTINTITLERIFADKILAAEFHYQRGMLFDAAKHLYDLATMMQQDRIRTLLSSPDGICSRI